MENSSFLPWRIRRRIERQGAGQRGKLSCVPLSLLRSEFEETRRKEKEEEEEERNRPAKVQNPVSERPVPRARVSLSFRSSFHPIFQGPKGEEKEKRTDCGRRERERTASAVRK